MKPLLISLIAVASLALAQEPAPSETTPIPPEDIAIVQALSDSLQQHQTKVQSAVAKQESRLCAEARIKREMCVVDWQKGTVGPKPKEPPAASTTPPAEHR